MSRVYDSCTDSEVFPSLISAAKKIGRLERASQHSLDWHVWLCRTRPPSALRR